MVNVDDTTADVLNVTPNNGSTVARFVHVSVTVIAYSGVPVMVSVMVNTAPIGNDCGFRIELPAARPFVTVGVSKLNVNTGTIGAVYVMPAEFAGATNNPACGPVTAHIHTFDNDTVVIGTDATDAYTWKYTVVFDRQCDAGYGTAPLHVSVSTAPPIFAVAGTLTAMTFA